LLNSKAAGAVAEMNVTKATHVMIDNKHGNEISVSAETARSSKGFNHLKTTVQELPDIIWKYGRTIERGMNRGLGEKKIVRIAWVDECPANGRLIPTSQWETA
jgi:hypothetical protein